MVLFPRCELKCGNMKKDKEKIKEPYRPEDTPQPPQEIDPDTGRKRENPVEGKGRSSGEPANKTDGTSEEQHLLDENTDIDDETTI
jgi:hypothetical protein